MTVYASALPDRSGTKTTAVGSWNPRRLFCYSVAAAAEQDNGDDNQPNPVIAQKIAQTVIHNRSSLTE